MGARCHIGEPVVRRTGHGRSLPQVSATAIGSATVDTVTWPAAATGRYPRSPVSNPPGSGWSYRLFGGLSVVGGDGRAAQLGGRKQRAVLAALLLELGRPVPTDRLIDRVWGDVPPPRAEASLQAYVSRLRRQLEPEGPGGPGHAVLLSEPGGYRIAADRRAVDLALFDELRSDAAAALAAGDAARAAELYDRALALHGPLLPELAGEDWVVEAATRIETAHADALDGLFEARLALGAGREIVGALEAAVAAYPYRERLRGQLAVALYRAGRQTDALRALAEARRILAEDIGVEPGHELRQVEADILAQANHLAAPAPAGGAPPATAGRRPAGQLPMVGRADELGWMMDAARRAAGGAGTAVVISGEPGIGKTRLAEELVAAVPDEFVVAWARCQESAASAPYWGYSQIAEQIVAADVISEAAREGMSAAGGGVHTIDPDADRATLHGSMVAALRSATRPLLLVVDDLQWADASSLRALEFVASTVPTVPVLLVVTVRPVGSDAPAPLVACLAELARHAGSQRIELAGLSHADVGSWLRTTAGGHVADDVVAFVHERTGGNPFFVGELVELLARQDRLTDLDAARGARVPAAAVDIVRRRVGMLPAETQQLLSTASVLGIAIDLDVLAHVAATTPGDALDVLDPAVDAGLLHEDATAPGRLHFAHALVADALAAELSAGRRTRLHAAVFDAIEHLRAASLDEQLAALVHHGRAGAVAGVASRAFEYAKRAAGSAAKAGAFEVAAGYWDGARSLLDLAHPGDRRARYDLLVELGRAQLRADDVTGAQQVLLDAISLAEALHDPAGVRGAAVALATTTLWHTSEYGQVDLALVDGLERALAASEGASSAELSLLMGALADALYYERDTSRSSALSARAVELARETADADVLALALSQRIRALWRGVMGPEQREVMTEMVALAAGHLDPGLAVVAHRNAAALAFSHADRAGFEQHLAAARALADRSQMPALLSQIAWAEVGWLLACGHYDDAAARAREADRLYRRGRGWQADDILDTFVLFIEHDQGTIADPLSSGRALLHGRFGAATREFVAWMLVEDGRPEDARRLVGPAGTVPDPPADWLWLDTITTAAHVRAGLGDRAASAALFERLRDHAGHVELTAGPFLGGMDLVLAALAEAQGDALTARHHAAAAIEVLERLDTPPALARALLVQGRLLANSGDDAQHDAGVAALDRARAVAERVGVVPVLAQLDRMQAGVKAARA
jgi:DNA-binding SARP family transcriptional activator